MWDLLLFSGLECKLSLRTLRELVLSSSSCYVPQADAIILSISTADICTGMKLTVVCNWEILYLPYPGPRIIFFPAFPVYLLCGFGYMASFSLLCILSYKHRFFFCYIFLEYLIIGTEVLLWWKSQW